MPKHKRLNAWQEQGCHLGDLKKELEAVRLEDRSTKSELSKAKIDLEKRAL